MAKKQHKPRRTRILAVSGAIVLLAALMFAWLKLREKPVEITTEKVARKEIVHLVTATGKIQPELEVAMSPDVSGEIISLPVREGQQVKAGELLFRIQPDIYENQVEQSRAQMNLSQAQSLDSKARMLKARDDFRKAELLYREKLISQSEWLSAKTAAESAAAAFQASRFSIEQNRSLLNQNTERLRKTVVMAPISGTITLLKSKLGERVVGTGQFPGTEVLRLANLDNMQVEVEVNENDIVNVRIGNPVTVTVDAFGDRKFSGVVREIGSSAITKAAGTQEEITNFSVKIRVLNHDRLLKPGMSATADIETIRIPHALVVPIQSVTIRDASGKPMSGESKENQDDGVVQAPPAGNRRNEGTEGVFVVGNGRVRFRKVTTGTTDNTHIEIRSGLNEGETVVSGSFGAITRELRDGSRVRLQERP